MNQLLYAKMHDNNSIPVFSFCLRKWMCMKMFHVSIFFQEPYHNNLTELSSEDKVILFLCVDIFGKFVPMESLF